MSALPHASSQRGEPVEYDPFAGAALQRVVPTTEPQREVWLADQLGRDASLAFNESVSLRLHGVLNVRALSEAVASLRVRRDSLRAVFGPDGETLCILAPTAFSIEPIDLSALTADDAQSRLGERQREAVEVPFDLLRGPLFRAELLCLAGDDHVLILTAHHIVCDGWSWWLIVRELGALYTQQLAGNASALPLAASFADYALAQASASRDSTGVADEAYWLSRFADTAPILDLPLDRPRPAHRGFASAREDYTLDAPLVTAVRRLGGRHGASLFAALLAGFAGVLARLSGNNDVVIGIPAAGQSVDEHDDIVGHCVNLLPLRCQIDPAQSFGVLLDATQGSLLDALDHQRYTYGELLKKLKVNRDPSRMPLVSVMFNIDQALDQQSTGFAGLRLEFACNPRSYENFEWFINAVQEHGSLRLECQYNRDLFDATTVQRWLAAYQQLLRAASEQPDAAFSALTWIDAEERARLQALQPDKTAFDRDCAMHRHFERQCQRAPDRIALRAGDASISYGDLEARANRIAHLLRAHGVRRGALVGLALDRGIDMVAAVLGILKSGAGYVPLDPRFPAERLAYMAGDAGLAALITQGTHADTFDLRGRPVLALEQLHEQLAASSAQPIGTDADSALPESIAYVIYTSGSTGRPKGVSVPHRAVANFIHAMASEPGMSADARLVAVTTLSFDIAVLEWLLPLSVGAQVIIADHDTSTDGVALMRLLAEQQASVMQATPATWRVLLEAGWQGSAAFTVLCGGEPLPPDLAAQLLPRCAALWNLYGPTETTVWSTCAQVLPGRDGALPDVHIGRPIANTQVWILDPHGNACPRGVPGEICIGGDGVTLGYLHRPELTAERFIADPFVTEQLPDAPPALLYRTGDRGRWRSDDNLQHLGRLDFQVKVRGYRIELGEIESALLRHPEVSEALAMAREDRPGDVRLVAYVVACTGCAADSAALTTHLRGTLPDYMIPQHVMPQAAMPRLPNGKIDRKALPAPNAGRPVSPERVMPRNEVEQRIANALAAVLAVNPVGIDDDFFALGGHSLLAAQLTARLSREFNLSLSLRTLFDAPTVAKLARCIHEQIKTGEAKRPAIQRRAGQQRSPLTPLQERVLVVESFNAGTLAYNTPSAHRLIGALDPLLMEQAFAAMAERQTVLRTSMVAENNEAVQFLHAHVATGLSQVIDLEYLPHAQRESEALRQIQQWIGTPFANLAIAPLFVARLFRINEDEHILFFMAHHIIWDGWSFDLLYSEISELYAALTENRSPVLPALPVTFGDYAAWFRQWKSGEEYRRQVEYWCAHLGGPQQGSVRLHVLPADKPRTRGLGVISKSVEVRLHGETYDRLHALSNHLGVTLFTTLLTAYYAVLSRLAGHDEIIVGTLLRGRNTDEVENLMGYFTNLLPLRARLDSAAAFTVMARRVRDVLLGGLANPDVMLEDIPAALTISNPAGAAMFYHGQFSFQDVRLRGKTWGNLRHERIEVLQPGASEDVALLVVESDTGLLGSFVYNSNLFHDETIVTMRDCFITILEQASVDPDQPLSSMLGQQGVQSSTVLQANTGLAASASTGDGNRSGGTLVAFEPSAVASVAVDPRETCLIGIWSKILHCDVVPSDNFFDLGGNSMQAALMSAQVFRRTGHQIRLLRLASQTLQQIAADMSGSGDAADPEPTASAPSTGLVGRLRRLFTRGERGGNR